MADKSPIIKPILLNPYTSILPPVTANIAPVKHMISDTNLYGVIFSLYINFENAARNSGNVYNKTAATDTPKVLIALK